MQRKKWNSSYFSKIFITMAAASFSVLLLALLGFQAEFSRATTQYLSAVNSKFVKNAAESIAYKTETAQRDVMTAYSTHYGNVLMASSEPSSVNMMLAMTELDNKISQNSSLHSVYFYNSLTQKISVFGASRSYVSLDAFTVITGDTDIVPILQQRKKTNPFARVLVPPLTSEKGISVFTQILWTPTTGGRKNAIVINLLPDELFGILKSQDTAYSEVQNNFLVYGRAGELLFDGVLQPALKEAGTEHLTQIIFAHAREAGGKPYRERVAGQTYLFHSYTAPDGRVFVNMVNKDELADSFSYSPIFFVSVVCGACIFGVGLVWLFSKMLYNPIGALTKQLRQNPRTAEEKGGTEIDFITRSITTASTKLDSLFAYKEKTLSLAQISFLQDQLLRNRYSTVEFWENSAAKELPYRPGDTFLLVNAIWCATEPIGIEPHLVHYAVANVFHELLDPELQAQQIPMGGNETLFLCAWQDGRVSTPALTSALQRIRTIFLQYFQLGLCFFISPPVVNPADFCATRAALQALTVYNYFFPEGAVETTSSPTMNARKTELCPLFDFELFEVNLRMGDAPACLPVLQTYFTALETYTYEAASASVSFLAARLIRCCKRVEQQLLANFSLDYNDLYTRMSKAKQLCAAHAAASQSVSLICAQIVENSDDTLLALAASIVERVDASYQDFNLSSKAIAVQHHISVPTLNRIFKRKTGDSVPNYIKKLRLAKAVDLLQKTTISVENIARNVGFENTKYFYTLFKAEYGVSPTQYRISHSVAPLQNLR